MTDDMLRVIRQHHEAAVVAHAVACQRQTDAVYRSSAYYEARTDAAVHFAVAQKLWAIVEELDGSMQRAVD